MNVLVLFLPSVRPGLNHGGSSKIVKDVAGFLGSAGHSVTLLCSRNDDNASEFCLSDRVVVKPILPYRQSWQDTYLVPPFDLASIVRTVLAHAETADRIVLFDSHFIFQDLLPPDKPLVASLRDFVYVQALQGSFLFRRDMMVVNSRFVSESYCDALAGFLPGVIDRIKVVPNGVDLRLFRRVSFANLRKRLGLWEDDWPVLLFPHRPETAKGIDEALAIIAGLRARGHGRAKLVVLQGSDMAIMPEVRKYYSALRRRINDLGLREVIVLVDWLPLDTMPALYSLADVTLCVGTLVESFSNSALESLACGTPVVASNIASFRDLLDDSALARVPPGDVDAAIDMVDRLLTDNAASQADRVRLKIASLYGHQAMLRAWHDLVVQASVLPVLETRLLRAARLYRIPAWISEQGNRLYNEYTRTFCGDALSTIWARHKRSPITVTDLADFLIDIPDYVSKGELVPMG